MEASVSAINTKPTYHLERQSEKAPKTLGLFNRGDSGYISPMTTPASNGATPSSDSIAIRRSLSGARVSSGKTSEESSPDTDLESSLDFVANPSNEAPSSNMQRTVNSPQRSYQQEASSPETQDIHFEHLLQRPPPEIPTLQTHLNTKDIILLAFECQSSHSNWNRCEHPYCVLIRKRWNQFRNCCGNFQQACGDCLKFKQLVTNHSQTCTNRACPVVFCSETKMQLQRGQTNDNDATNTSRKSGLHRSHSFTERTPTSENRGLPAYLASYDYTPYEVSDLSIRGLFPDSHGSLTRDMITAKAEEIVDRLDKEEPLLNNNSTSSDLPSLPSQRPTSLHASDHDEAMYHGVQGGGIALSPIVEMPGREDMSISPTDTYSFGDSHVSLIMRSNNPYTSYAYSSLGDGVLGGIPSMGGVSQLGEQQEPSMEVTKGIEKVYPTQKLLHKLNNAYLSPGQDSYYHQNRDYYLNDVDRLGEGGFGTCVVGKDNSSENVFAMKRNNKSSEVLIDSIRAECFVLSRLQHHKHVICFYGAVIDEDDADMFLPRVCKMFMELADGGNLADMLVVYEDENQKELAPLPIDQSLYYIEQVLQGVHFLHQNGVLHLDIKAVNVLVFEGGRTVKLADFGTAVELSEIAAVGGKLTGVTPYFAPPEVVHSKPGFSSDIWGVMCVFVELLTTKWPGCHKQTIPHHQMLYLVGKYQDCDIEELIPLSEMNLDPEIEQLFRRVFVAEPADRPSALTLLQHPRLIEAPEYEREFDCCYDDEDYEEMSQEMPEIAPQPMSIIGQATPIQGTQLTPSQPPQLTPLPQPYLRSNSDLERDFIAHKRDSHDSGTGEDLESSINSRGFPQRSSTGGSSGSIRPDYSKRDSGFDTPGSADVWRSKFNNWPVVDSSFTVEGVENYEDCHSFPMMSATKDHTHFQRSSSIHGCSYKHKTSDSNTPIPMSHSKKLLPPSHRLYHSYSAPVVGDNYARRRLSLQMIPSSKEGEELQFEDGRPKLRRTSSMVYVDKGPEIDSPEKEKRSSIEKLISDVSGLNLDHTHSPTHRHSRQPDSESVVVDIPPVAKVASLVSVFESNSQHSTSSTNYGTRPSGYSNGRGLVHKAPPTTTHQVKNVTVYETIC